MTTAAKLIEKYRLHDKDTGSTVFQIILLSQKIEKEQLHLVNNKKDVPAKRAIVKKNARRKRFYQYLIKHNPETFQQLQKENKDLMKFLGIKG